MARDGRNSSSNSAAAWRYSCTLAAMLSALALLGAPVSSAQGPEPSATVKVGASGLRVPRFVSLKSDRVNVRKGPSTGYAVDWVFSRAGLPVEVLAESENWRQIRDSEGSEGWVFHALLSGRRTALVMPWVRQRRTILLHDEASTGSDVVARLESGVLGSVHKCDGEWCNFTVGNYNGWIEQERLWGVYRNEEVK